jgi:glycogenin glucosyltransferase
MYRRELKEVFDHTVRLETLDSGDGKNLALLGRPELGITFTKLRVWSLTDYVKAVFLDADTMVLHNIDELFERSVSFRTHL